MEPPTQQQQQQQQDTAKKRREDDMDETKSQVSKSSCCSDSSSSFVVLGGREDGVVDLETASMKSGSDWSLLEEFNNHANITGIGSPQGNEMMKLPPPQILSPHHSHESSPPADVLTSRLSSYLKECIMQLQGDVRVLPDRDLKARVVQFLRGTTYDARTCGGGSMGVGGGGGGGGEEEEEVRDVGYKCTSSDDATWDAIRWNGFCTEKKPVSQFPTVSVARDFNVAYSHYCMYLSSKQNPTGLGRIIETNVEFSRLSTLHHHDDSESDFGDDLGLEHGDDLGMEHEDGSDSDSDHSDYEMTTDDRAGLTASTESPEPQLPSNTESGWIVATVLVTDPFTGKLPDVPTRYVPIMDRQYHNGLVRLYEFPRQVLPLVRFDAARFCEDEMMLKQISQGVMGILGAFFG